MQLKPLVKGYALLILAGVLFGTTGTARALGAQDLAPWAVGAFRLIIGGPALLAFGLVFRTPPPKEERSFPLGLTALACLGVVSFQLAFFESVSRTGVAVGTMVSIGSSPVFAGILGILVHKEILDRRWALAALLSIAGCAFLAGQGQVGADVTGIGLALVSGAGYAIYLSAGRGLVRILSPDKAVGMVLCAGGLIMLPMLLAADLSPLTSPRTLLTLIYLGFFATALSYTCLGAGLTRVPLSTAALLLLAEPLVGSLLGIFVLKEPFTLETCLGMGLIFAGMGLTVARQG